MAIFYKALSKTQIAQDAEVSEDTVASWCRNFEEKMKPFGYKRHSKVLNPACVKLLAEHYVFRPRNCIEI